MIEEKTQSSQEVDAAKEQQKAATGGRPTMHIKIYSPFQVYFDEEGYSMSGVNATGPFDVLPHHHNFLSLLGACELIIRPVNTPPEEQRIRISGGLMHVKADKVTVFLDV
jgi:F0F1-type ATP synthase epsilon subunit